MTEFTTYEFHDADSLEGVAKNHQLQADTQAVYVVTKDSDADLRMYQEERPDVRTRAEEVDDFVAVYNPESGQIFDCVTDGYEVINPPEFIGPLCDELREREKTDIDGRIWARQDGAAAYGQLLFNTEDYAIWPEDGGREHPVRAGFNFRWSHNSGMSVKAEGFAQDGACQNTIRQVTSSIHVKHSGNVDERVDWGEEWTHVLDQMGAFSDALAGIIDEAIDHTMFDLRPESDDSAVDRFDGWREASDPIDTINQVSTPGMTEDDRDALYGFYELLGFPKYISVAATSRLMARLTTVDDPRVITTWDVHSALTYALSHQLRGTPGASDDNYHRWASEVLMNPEKTIRDASETARETLTPESEGGAFTIGTEEEPGGEGTGDALRQYNERARTLESAFGGD